MPREIELLCDTKDHVLIIRGKRYRLKNVKEKKNGHLDKMVFTEINEQDYGKRIDKLTKSLIENTNLDAQKILSNILSQESIEKIEKLENALNAGKKPKIEDGCLNIRVGKEEINIC